MIHVRPYERGDDEQLKLGLSADDRATLTSYGMEDVGPVIRHGLALSVEVVTASANSQVLAIGGVLPSPDPGVGLPWILVSEGLARHRLAAGRISRAWVDRMHLHFPTLTAFVPANASRHHRWVMWCGFDPVAVVPPTTFAPIPHIQFVRTKP